MTSSPADAKSDHLVSSSARQSLYTTSVYSTQAGFLVLWLSFFSLSLPVKTVFSCQDALFPILFSQIHEIHSACIGWADDIVPFDST